MAPTHEEETVEAVFVDGMRGNVEPGLEFFSSAVMAIYQLQLAINEILHSINGIIITHNWYFGP